MFSSNSTSKKCKIVEKEKRIGVFFYFHGFCSFNSSLKFGSIGPKKWLNGLIYKIARSLRVHYARKSPGIIRSLINICEYAVDLRKQRKKSFFLAEKIQNNV